MNQAISSSFVQRSILSRGRAFTLMLIVCASAVTCAPRNDDAIDPDDALTIGLLLPFTGASAATASNFERAVLLAADTVNRAGGVQGKLIRVVARDTHSNISDAEASLEELLNEGAIAIIGPESPEIADAIRGRINEEEAFLVSPYVGEGEEVDLDCDFPWYRLAPSARALGENLANDLASDLARGDQAGVAILYGPGQYDNAFRRGVRDKFESELVGGKVLMEGLLDGGSSSQSRAIEQALAAGPDAIVLSLSAQGASSVFTEATLRDSSLGWKFSPLLKTPLFTQNISVELAEGATGIAPKIFDTTDDFPNAFAERWRGDQPLEGAYFYYDAISLLSIAFGLLEDVKDFSYAELGEAIVQASSSRGVSVGWDELDRGLEKLKEGVAVNYSGLTGPILLQPCGERRTGATQPWAVRSGEIVEVTE